MANELWDLSETVERMAVAMWSHDAWRARMYSTAQERTLDAFRSESEELREKWIGLAGAGLEAAFKPRKFGG